MKQNYSIIKDNESGKIFIRESAELDKDTYSPLCEESYDIQLIVDALKDGPAALVNAIRTRNLYPPGLYATRIALAVAALITSEDETATELYFDDVELLSHQLEEQMKAELNAMAKDINEMLADGYDDDINADTPLGKIGSSLKVADDEYADFGED